MQNLFKTLRKTAAIIANNKKPVYQCLPFFLQTEQTMGQLFGLWQLNPEFQTYSCSMINIVVRHLACLLHEQHSCTTPCLSLTWSTWLYDTLPVSYVIQIFVRPRNFSYMINLVERHTEYVLHDPANLLCNTFLKVKLRCKAYKYLNYIFQ